MKNAIILRNGLALAVLACATLVAAQERAFAQQGCIEKVPPPVRARGTAALRPVTPQICPWHWTARSQGPW
jgi:hypothetical protein